jgi:predicted DNA-binding transcriptional regulator AlpA
MERAKQSNSPAPSANQPAQPRFARPKSVCERYQISRGTLWRWSRALEGFPQPVRAGRVTLFDVNAIDAYLTKGGV